MSVIEAFDNTSDEIIKPWRKPEIEGFPETVIVTFSDEIQDCLTEDRDAEGISEFHSSSCVPIYKIKYKERDLAVFLSWPGAPSTVNFLEGAAARGAKKFLIFGSCGSLDNNITDGHIVVPTEAYRDEGTSYHYMPASAGDYVKVKTADKLLRIFKELKIPAASGKTWTTDAFYRETRKNMEKRKAEGCVTVEMECSAVMAFAQFRGVEAYQFLYTADNLDRGEWESRLLGAFTDDHRKLYAKIALETAVLL